MVKTADSESLTDDIYHRLRTALVRGRYPAGSRLRPAELAEDYGVSHTIVRHALVRIAAQHLVEATPNRGYHVAGMTSDDMRDLVEVRIINEVAALRSAIEHGDVNWESEIIAAFHRMGSFDLDTDEWFDAHRNFHLAMLSAAPNARLVMLCEELLELGDLYLRWSRQIAAGTDVKSVWAARATHAEHERIMSATLARDADLAAAQYASHLRLTLDLASRSTDDPPA